MQPTRPNDAPPKKRDTGSFEISREMKSPLGNVPWTLQQFFKGQIDLDAELVQRFPNMPLMSTIRFRKLGANSDRRVATLGSQDGSAMLVADANLATRELQLSFTFGSMLTLRFQLIELSDMDRARWLDLMRRKQGGLAFLWGQNRWNNDYAICVLRKYYVSLLAFSRQNFEAAVRLTPDVNHEFIGWLEGMWRPQPVTNTVQVAAVTPMTPETTPARPTTPLPPTPSTPTVTAPVVPVSPPPNGNGTGEAAGEGEKLLTDW